MPPTIVNGPGRRRQDEARIIETPASTVPRLTVAIPTYNGARHLPEAIRSALGQGLDGVELIVSDDRSDDDSAALAREVAGDRARVEVNSERLGLAGNWNRCLDRARSDWVAILHQDDVWRPGHLDSHRVAIEADDGSTGMIAGPAGVIDDAGRPVPPGVVDPGGVGARPGDPAGPPRRFAPGEMLASLTSWNPLRCSAVTVRRADALAVGGFDPAYRYVVDWEFWIRLTQVRHATWIGGPPTLDVRWHPGSETHRFRVGIADLEETATLLDAIRALPGPRPRGWRQRADARLARAYLNRAYTAARSGDRPTIAICLNRSLRLRPLIALSLFLDPRLVARLAIGASGFPRY